MDFLEHVRPSGAVTMIVGCKPKTTLVYAPGRTVKERRLRVTRHRSSFHVCQPCRDVVTTRSELTRSTSKAGEFEETRYQGLALVVHPNTRRWEQRKDRMVSQIDGTNTTNAYVDHSPYHVQCPPFTLYNMVPGP